MKPILLTDSASDIAAGSIDGVHILPLKIFFGDEEYLDTITLSHEEFYKKLIESNTLPTTSQIPPYEFEKAFADLTKDGRQVVVITLSQKLSGTYQSAAIAAQGFEGKVFLVDSESVAIGQRILVEYARNLIALGMQAAEVAAELERVKTRICVIALLDTLEYLKAGGRISQTAAFAGSLLNIKPVVAIVNGEVALLGKARGSKNGSNLLRELITARGGVDFTFPYRLGYTGLSDQLLKKYIEDSADLWSGSADSLPVSTIGGTIGTHVGPGVIAVAFFANELK